MSAIHVVLRARFIAQEYGATKGLLGDCGEKAVRVVLEHLLNEDDGRGWLTVEGTQEVEDLLEACRS